MRKKMKSQTIKFTPLHYACRIGKQNAINFLISKGANYSILDRHGRTAQELADLMGNGVKINTDVEFQWKYKKYYKPIRSIHQVFNVHFTFQ
jgi:predicted glycoside hydrolase/deacetylase ChbG (UPF0249 family)